MRKNKKEILTAEDVKNMIGKRWKPANNYQTFLERAIEGKEKFLSGENLIKKDDNGNPAKIDKYNRYNLNHIKMIFKKYPETFAIDNFADTIAQKYNISHVGMHSKEFVQSNYFDSTFRMMKEVSKELNKYVLSKSLIQKEIQKTKISDKGESRMTAKYSKINNEMKQNFSDDGTLLTELCDNKITEYLSKHYVKTVGDLMKYLGIKKNYASYNMYCNRFEEEYKEFYTSILNYANEKENTNISEQTLVDKTRTRKIIFEQTKGPVKSFSKADIFDYEGDSLYDDDGVLDNPNQVKETRTKSEEISNNSGAIEKINTGKKEIDLPIEKLSSIEDLEKIDAKYFDLGSDSMEKIYDIVKTYLNNLVDSYIYDIDGKEVEDLVEEEKKKYRDIVDRKRALLAKSKEADRIKRNIARDVKYKFNTKKQSNLPHKHNYFAEDDELLF